MTEEMRVEETRQRVIAMVGEARARIEKAKRQAGEIRAREDLGAERKQSALDEVVAEASARAEQAVRDARHGVKGGWVVGTGGVGTPVKSWDEGLSEEGLAARDAMLGYLDQAERVLGVDLEELETGEAPSASASAERDAAAAEVSAYEAAHPAPAGVAPARDRWATIE